MSSESADMHRRNFRCVLRQTRVIGCTTMRMNLIDPYPRRLSYSGTWWFYDVLISGEGFVFCKQKALTLSSRTQLFND